MSENSLGLGQAFTQMLAASALYDQLQGFLDFVDGLSGVTNAWRALTNSIWNIAFGSTLGAVDFQQSSMYTASLFVGLSFVVGKKNSIDGMQYLSTSGNFFRSFLYLYGNSIPIALIAILILNPTLFYDEPINIILLLPSLLLSIVIFVFSFLICQLIFCIRFGIENFDFSISYIGYVVGTRSRRILFFLALFLFFSMSIDFINHLSDENCQARLKTCITSSIEEVLARTCGPGCQFLFQP